MCATAKLCTKLQMIIVKMSSLSFDIGPFTDIVQLQQHMYFRGFLPLTVPLFFIVFLHVVRDVLQRFLNTSQSA
jgi:hypothetical protein